jgi:phosphoribosylaminoimidazolecarboxamide formyltransferase/IMP cyclohydrolase
MYAIVSVHEKSGVEGLSRAFQEKGIIMLATPGTRTYLHEHGVECRPVADITGFDSMCEGGVKTLHPLIHKMITTGEIAYVVVDFIPSSKAYDGSLGMDIGGPALVLSGIKHHARVCVVADARHVPELTVRVQEGTADKRYRARNAKQAMEELITYQQGVLALLGDEDDPGNLRTHH